MDWLPDIRLGTLELRDILSLVLTAVGAGLAWLAIRMGERQEEATRKQGEIIDKQLELAHLEVETTKHVALLLQRQMEITEAQYAITERQLGKSTRVRFAVMQMEYYSSTPFMSKSLVKIANDGDAPVEIDSWTIHCESAADLPSDFALRSPDGKVDFRVGPSSFFLSPGPLRLTVGAGESKAVAEYSFTITRKAREAPARRLRLGWKIRTKYTTAASTEDNMMLLDVYD
jgi:hypothetical protein